jgi:hypothetical protein
VFCLVGKTVALMWVCKRPPVRDHVRFGPLGDIGKRHCDDRFAPKAELTKFPVQSNSDYIEGILEVVET